MFWSSWQAYLLVEFLQNFGLFLGTILGDREMFFSYSYDVCWWHSYLFPLISEIELQLNLELINLSEWLSTNKLILNLKKTEFMVFGTHQRLCRQDIDGAHITLGGESVKHCDAFKYLGVVLDNSLSFNLHIDCVKK